MPRLFPEKHYIALSEVLAIVDRHSGFLAGFQHWKQRYHRPRPARRTFFAGIAALGCDIGTGKILRISREINAAELENAVNWYFYPESLHEVNDALLRFAVAAGSAVSWRHINLLGEYDFSDEKLRDSVGIRPPKPLALPAS